MAMKWETQGGLPTRGLVYSQLLEKLRECRELTGMMAHLHQTESNNADKLLAKGWLGIGELIERMEAQITKMAMKRMQ